MYLCNNSEVYEKLYILYFHFYDCSCFTEILQQDKLKTFRDNKRGLSDSPGVKLAHIQQTSEICLCDYSSPKSVSFHISCLSLTRSCKSNFGTNLIY